ncbi:MAG: class I SAM-dependent methyltransferase [Kiloniellales bacterium]
MSRLDSAIRRLQAQRACLDAAIEATRDLPGPILELGLGNGRTYDHLRSLSPGREIFVFDRQVAAHPDSLPDAAHLLLGELQETLPHAASRFGATVALLHADLGSGNAERDAATTGFVAGWLPRLLRPGGVVVGDQDLRFAGAEPLPLPQGVEPGRYFLYRAAVQLS